MDDFVDRFLKTIGLICAGFVLLYVLIATSGEGPTGVSLLIYSGMNWLFCWLLRIAGLGLLGLVLVFVRSRYLAAQAEKEQRIQQEIKERERKIREEEQRKEEMEQKRIETKKAAQKEKESEIENLRRQKEREDYLKNRSAEAANKDALNDFL